MDSFELIDAAVCRKDFAALDQLLESENLDSRDQDGRTPLMYAIVAEDADERMVEYLVNHGADVNAVDRSGQWTPLHFAARDRKAEMVKILLNHGAAVDPVDSNGNTPLSNYITSSYPRDPAVVDSLLAHGADPCRKNAYGIGPIDVARTIGDWELVNRLERRAADR